MANTFLLAKGFNVGKSLVETELIETANKILKKAINYNCNIILPTDVVCSNDLNDSINIKHSDIDDILSNQMILDIGNKTVKDNYKNFIEFKYDFVEWSSRGF